MSSAWDADLAHDRDGEFKKGSFARLVTLKTYLSRCNLIIY
jgi:hypothetical protein